jgi:ribosomal-protein-alanine N-acetyltransferase
VEGYERGDFGGWGVILKDSGEFVGTCGVDVNYAPEHTRAELGYVLSRDHWGRGLMPEAVRAVIRFGFGCIELNRIQARCIAENTASARVMEKAGMTYEGDSETIGVHQGRLQGHEDLLDPAPRVPEAIARRRRG